MRGSSFPNGVLVDHSALRFVETTKSEEILRNRTSITSRGVFSGFGVTVNAIDNTKIDVALGSGFTPRGDFIATTSNYYSIVLSDYTLNVINYVTAVYTEVGTHSQTHESNGHFYPTRMEMAWRIRVYEETAYNALAATDANLANDARDRMIILAKVTGNGIGMPLTASNITGPVEYQNLLYANPSELVTITGVTIVSASPSTPTGVGVVSYTYAVGPIYTLQWTPYGGVTAGPVAITGDGYYNLPDSLGEYIRVYVVVSQLLTTGAFPMTESVAITNLYYQAIPRFTGEDKYHRDLIGTGVLSPINPHAMSIADIAGDALPQLEEHQDVMHCNGIWRGCATGVLQSAVTVLPAGDILTIQAPIPSDLYYINGNKLNSVSSAAIPFATWLPEWGVGLNTRTHFFEVYMTDTGALKASSKAYYPLPRNLRGTWIVDMSPNYPAGSYVLDYVVSGASTLIRWDGGPQVYVPNADFGTLGNGRVIRLFDAEGVYWIDLWVNLDNVKHGSNDWDFNSGAGPLSDTITVNASPDWDANMQISAVSYWYDNTGVKVNLGYAPYIAVPTVSNRVIDKRPFGTLCEEVISDSALQGMVYNQQDEMHYSGVLLDRGNPGIDFSVESTSVLNMTIRGGYYYCRGRRLFAAGDTVTLINNKTNLVWLDMQGNYNVIDVTTTYGGNLQNAMYYVLGSNSDMPNIDNTTHPSDTRDAPERGVLLYVGVTSGGAISYYEDMTRNVNGPVDPWSVASRSTNIIFYRRAAAFNSLYAAFAYASLSNRIHDINIRIIGSTSISNTRITQPSGITVTGGKEASPGNIVTVGYSNADGVWNLSGGCKVSNVDIVVSAPNTAVFGLGTTLTSSSDNVTIEGCKVDAPGVGTYFIRMSEAGFVGASISNLVVKNNKVTVGTSFINNDTAALDYYNFDISGNVITLSGSATTAAISIISATTGRGILISNNIVIGHRSVALSDFSASQVVNNSFILGHATVDVAVYGVIASNLSNCTIAGNKFEQLAASAAVTTVTAISTYVLFDCIINDNTITNVHWGIMDLVAGLSSRLIIKGNIIKAYSNAAHTGGGVGILTWGNDILISDNNIYAEANGIGCGPSTGATRVKIADNIIYLVVENGGLLNVLNIGALGGYGIAAANGSNDITLENNTVTLEGASGILVAGSAAICMRYCGNHSINGCTTKAVCNSVAGGGFAAHIWIAFPAPNKHFSVTNCKVDNRTNIVDPSPVDGIYIYDFTGTGVSTVGRISGNLIDGNNPSGGPGLVNELYINTTAAIITVSDNDICDLTVGGPVPPKISITPALTTPPAAGALTISHGDNALINSTGWIVFV